MAARKSIPKVEIVSKEMIKPSSPTPSDRRSYQISSLDQFANHNYIRFILFYNRPFAAHILDLVQVLKDSLSQTLTHYYPLAGKLVEEDARVVCDDSGAEFTSAVVIGDDLRKVIENPSMDSLERLLSKRDGIMKSEDALLAVQITQFDGDGEGGGGGEGGGITVGVCLSHLVADAATLCSFLKCWSAAARMFFSGESSFNELTSLGPILDAAPKLWPPVPGLSCPSGTPGDGGKMMVKRFDFSSSSITRLKSDLTGGENPTTRVTSIMALIWHTIMESSSSPAKHVLTLPTNIRRKMSPPLPDNTFGNILKLVAVSTLHNHEDEVGDGVGPAVQGILGRIKEAMEKVNEEYARKKGIPLHQPFSAVFSSDAADTTAFELNITLIVSWCGFPFYEVDLGFGRPTWMTNLIRPISPLVLLLDGTNNGLEVLVGLHEETMNKFEKNPTLLSFCDHFLTF